MDSRNIYDMFRENVELRKLIDRYHRVLREKDKTIKNLQERIEELDGITNSGWRNGPIENKPWICIKREIDKDD